MIPSLALAGLGRAGAQVVAGPPTDPYFADVALLINGTDADETTTFTDHSPSPKTITAVGSNVKNETAEAKFGITGVQIDTRDSCLTVGSAADWVGLNGGTAWVLDGWLRFDDFSVVNMILSTSLGSTANIGIYLGLRTARQIECEIYYGSVGNTVLSGVMGAGGTWPNDALYHFLHLAYDPVPASDNLIASIDAAASAALTKTGNTPSGSNPSRTLAIGALNASSPSTFWKGAYGHLRLTFAGRPATGVPTAAFPQS